MKGPFIFALVVSIFLLIFLMNTTANWLEAQPTPQNKRFEVVDTYKDCDVVRYTADNSARYSYFLDCRNER